VFVGLVLTFSSCPLGVPLHLLLYTRGRCYKEGNRVGYNMIPIRTLSLLIYFTNIFIDIIIYVVESMTWSSRIFWMVDRVVADPSLGLPSPCGMIPRVPILVTNKRYRQSYWLFRTISSPPSIIATNYCILGNLNSFWTTAHIQHQYILAQGNHSKLASICL
jgi:hypothetical protein